MPLIVYDREEPFPYETEFMMSRNKWDEIVRSNYFEERPYNRLSIKTYIKETSYMAYYQLYFNKKILSICNIPFKLLHSDDNDPSSRNIFLPHCDLEFVFNKYEKIAYSPLPMKTFVDPYNKAKLLFQKILSVKNDDEKWIEALTETNDDFFVQQNVEFRIGKDMRNKKLWKLYIAYLKERNPKYCRFFLDDYEMRMEYEQQVKIHGPVEVPWTNLFTPSEEINVLERIKYIFTKTKPPQFQQKPFEINSDHFYGMMCDYKLMRKSKDRIENLLAYTNILPGKYEKPLLQTFYSKDEMIFQSFPYCSTIINFILKNANAKVLQKLFKSCKEFYSRHPTPVCYKLTLQQSCFPLKPVTCYQESLIVGDKDPASIYHGKKLAIRTRLFASGQNSPKMLSSFIQKIHRCDAKFIEIYHQILSVKEFEFLTKNGTVEELILTEVPIIDEDEQWLPLEEIMERVLSVRMIEASNSRLYTSQTAESLSKLPFKNKLQRVFLWEINVELDPNAFSKFIKKNAADNCRIKTRFTQVSEEFKKEYFKTINETIARKWKHPCFHPICIPESPRVRFTPVEGASFFESDPTWSSMGVKK